MTTAAPCRRLIFNADDFGLSQAINQGIIKAHRAGLLRSASLMMTAPGYAQALELARANPSLDLGLHLALTEVQPALPPVSIPSLVDGGRFLSLPRFLMRLAARRVPADEVRRELWAQVERARAEGLRLSHLDSHHHVHLFRPVAGIAGEIARELGVPHLRRVTSLDIAGTRSPATVGKRALLHWADRRSAPALRGMGRVDAFRGIPFPASRGDWERLLGTLPPGVTEFMCHPGEADPVATGDPIAAQRATELRWLCDPALKEMLERYQITAVSFAETGGCYGDD